MRLLIDERVPGSAQTRVLLVDDQVIVGESIRRMLSVYEDLVLMHVRQPSEVFRAAAQIRPTVILLDLNLGGVAGLDVLEALLKNEQTATIPVVIMSSTEGALVKHEAFHMGASDYVVKLPDELELIARLRAHSRSYAVTRERDALLAELEQARAELEERARELDRLSRIDGLTGIANRRAFDEAFSANWQRATHPG